MLKEGGARPYDWRELFEFMNYLKARGNLADHARRVAEASRPVR